MLLGIMVLGWFFNVDNLGLVIEFFYERIEGDMGKIKLIFFCCLIFYMF